MQKCSIECGEEIVLETRMAAEMGLYFASRIESAAAEQIGNDQPGADSPSTAWIACGI